VSATGTGKTLVSIRVADELGAHLVLFVVPTLDLAAQTALAWRADHRSEPMVIVSSTDASARPDLVAGVGSTGDAVGLAESADLARPRRHGTPAGAQVETAANSMDRQDVYGKVVFEYPPPRPSPTAARRIIASWCPPSPVVV